MGMKCPFDGVCVHFLVLGRTIIVASTDIIVASMSHNSPNIDQPLEEQK